MAKTLVIVESPAKAKTISRFLDSSYQVEASVGHIRDLPANRKGLPEEHRKKWWADFAVDVDNNFEPFYEVPSEKSRYVDKLKKALVGMDEIVLATDEDREGESISWHLLAVLKPKKGVKVHRIAFHEITKSAILDALKNPRPIDERLVEAQEARRILDRLYGYTLSPVLWSKVAKELSAGRVQSPAVKLIVERERRRRDFVISIYWDLKAEVEAKGQQFGIVLKRIESQNLATGKDFDELTGELNSKKVLLLDESAAGNFAESAKAAKPWTILSIETNPGQEKQPAPFRTTTLQQEANRKFGFPADRTMRIAQDLYEGVDFGGERVGLITYMRTDSLSLAESAVQQARDVIRDRFGAEYLPTKPHRYASKVANAQEAHEAIRPTDFQRSPDSMRQSLLALSESHFKLYDLIYRRTLASQMKPAEVQRTQVEIEAEVTKKSLVFGASGKQITFPGFLLAYVEDVDDADAELEGKERILPAMKVGDEVMLISVDSARHETKPPARFTDASLIKALEDLGIGRPSTYAQIISVIVDRGYVWKKARELVPTFTAFLVVEVLDNHFSEFSDLRFTAKMDETLDEIAGGKQDSRTYLRDFFLGGNGSIGLKEAVDNRKADIPFANVTIGNHPDSGEPIIVRVGKGGDPFLQLGEASSKRFANVPDDMPPAELNVAEAIKLFSAARPELESVGIHPQTGRNLLLKQRGGFYLEVERTEQEITDKLKPTWVSVPPETDPRDLSKEDLDMLCQMPIEIGIHPELGEPILFRIGKYGPYIQSGKVIRNYENWRHSPKMTIAEAVEVLAMDKMASARASRQSAGPIQEFGELPDCAGPVKVLPGRFGPYVTDGTTNATIPKSLDPATLSASDAQDLLRKKREAGPSTRSKRVVRRKGSKAVARKNR